MNIEKIIRGYDIRGKYGTELTIHYVCQIINSVMQFLLHQDEKVEIAIGMDSRPHSMEIFDTLVKELSAFDVRIFNCGTTTTPALAYFSKISKCYGIMITASHNHISYNGLKFIKPDVQALDGSEIGSILKKFPHSVKGCGISDVVVRDCNKIYADFLIQSFPNLGPNLKVLWNPLNSSSTLVLNILLSSFRNTNRILNDDMNNMKHHPEPLFTENLVEMEQAILENQCDVGFIFDGDCDRVSVFDSFGKYISSEHVTMIFAEYWSDKIRNKEIICDVRSSHKLHDFLKKLGYSVIVGQIGHSKMKKVMAKTGAKFSSETSGHFIFDDLGFDDGLYTALFLFQILSGKRQTLREIVDKLPRIFCSGNIRFYLELEEVDDKIEKLLKHSVECNLECDRTDGVKVFFSEGWILFCRSKTENCLTVTFESTEEKDFEKIKSLVYDKFFL